MLKKDPTVVEFAEYMYTTLTTETPISEKLRDQPTVTRMHDYSPLSSLLAEIGERTEQDDIRDILHKMKLCD